MSTEAPPIQSSIFNQSFFDGTEDGTGITEAYLAANYLKFPTSQTATETINSLTATTLTATNDATIKGLTVGKGNGSITDNTAFGVSVLGSISGTANTAIGYRALRIGTTARFNTAVGAYTLTASTTGDYNTAIGNQALTAANTGSNNTAVGAGALESTTSGSNNVALGVYAGGYGASSNTTGSNNTYIGYQATSNANSYSNSTALGSGATITGSNQIIIGTSTEKVYIGGSIYPLYIVASGTAVPTATAGTGRVNILTGLTIPAGYNYIVATVSNGDVNVQPNIILTSVFTVTSPYTFTVVFSNASAGAFRVNYIVYAIV